MRKYFKFHGLLGLGLGGIALLVVNIYLVVVGVLIQQREATNYYQIDSNIHSLKANSTENHKYYKLVK
jgi:hypothetical protein